MRLPDKSDTRFPFTGESCGAALRAIGLASFPSGTSTRAAPGGQRGRQRGTPKGGRAGTRPDLAICGQPAHSKRDVSHIQPATSLPLTPSFLLPSGAAFVLRHASDRRTRFFLAIYCGPCTSQVGCGQRQSPRTAGLGARADLGRRGLARGDKAASRITLAPVRPDCC